MEKLMRLARQARENAYAPYSDFKVGAALLCAGGNVYTGCNVENASYGATCCAERVALFKAVSDGGGSFTDIAVAGNKRPTIPCGICLQVLAEHCGNINIWLEGDGESINFALTELMTRPFCLKED